MSTSNVEKRGSGATVRACDSCRRRKRKCAYLPGASVCTPCLSSKDECSTTHIRKPRAKSMKRNNRIVEYESRIQRLETLLQERTTAQPRVTEQPLQPADQTIPLSDYVSNLQNEIVSWPLEEGPHLSFPAFDAGFEYGDSNLQFNVDPSLSHTSPEGTFWPSSSSEAFTEPSNSASGALDLNNDPSFIMSLAPGQTPKMQITHAQPPLVRAVCDGYLPTPELGTRLLREFLVDFNTAVPLYRPYVVADHLRVCYAGESDGTIISWASTYVVFGIAHRLRAMSAFGTPNDNEQADYYLRRIIQNVPELLLQPPTMGIIQCLLGLATLIQTSSHTDSHGSFVSMALRMAQALAYDEEKIQSLDPNRDVEQERRVFWVAFFMDTDEGVLSIAPVAHRREDMVSYQNETDSIDAAGTVSAAEGNWRVNICNLRARLALLQAVAIETVFSVKAHQVTPHEFYTAVRRTLQNFTAWREHELFKLDAAELQQLLYQSDIVHVLGLEASYFATVFRVQSSLVLGIESVLNPFSVDGLTALAAQRQHSGYKDARRFLSLVSVAPQGDVGICWTIKTSITAALCTALSHTLHNPTVDPPTSAELQAYVRILQLLSLLAQKKGDAELQRTKDLCMGLFTRASAARRYRHGSSSSMPETMVAGLEQTTF